MLERIGPAEIALEKPQVITQTRIQCEVRPEAPYVVEEQRVHIHVAADPGVGRIRGLAPGKLKVEARCVTVRNERRFVGGKAVITIKVSVRHHRSPDHVQLATPFPRVAAQVVASRVRDDPILLYTALWRVGAVQSDTHGRKVEARKKAPGSGYAPEQALNRAIHAKLVHHPGAHLRRQARGCKVGTGQVIEAMIGGNRSADVLADIIVVVVKVGQVEPVGRVQVECQFSCGVPLLPRSRHDTACVVSHLKRIDECFNRSWNRDLRTLASGRTLDRGEIECLITNKRAAQGTAVLLPPEGRDVRGRRCDTVVHLKRRLIESVVAQKVKRVAVNVIAAGLENHVHRAGAAAAELGGIAGRHDLKFLDGFQTQPGSTCR